MGKQLERTESRESASVYELPSYSSVTWRNAEGLLSMEKNTHRGLILPQCQLLLGIGNECKMWGIPIFSHCMISGRSCWRKWCTHADSGRKEIGPVFPSAMTLFVSRITCWIRQNIKYTKGLLFYLNLLMFFSETLIKRTMGYILALIKSFVQLIPASRRQCLF